MNLNYLLIHISSQGGGDPALDHGLSVTTNICRVNPFCRAINTVDESESWLAIRLTRGIAGRGAVSLPDVMAQKLGPYLP